MPFFYPAALPLSRQILTCTAGVIRRHRPQTGSPWRTLNPGAGPREHSAGETQRRTVES